MLVFSLIVLQNVGFAIGATVKRKAIDFGTKVESAVEMRSSSCTDRYTACMDAGCMVDNESGGRCQCSNKIKDLDAEFEKLRKKDSQTASLATLGKEIIEMGKYEDELMPDDSDDGSDSESFNFSGSVGDKLRAEMHDICIEKLPECKSQLTLITNLYSQKIKSDCVAYENALSVKNQEAKERRADAKKAVRTAALEQHKASNKYDLGQCVAEFTSCMKTDTTCGDDWTGCIDNLGYDKMNGKKVERVVVSGENSSVSIAKSTMNVLESKKIVCEGVTNQCVSVKDKVWTAFLKNAIPDIKSAELLAESNARTSCLTNITNCFVKACKDNIDEKNPDSYDFCLTRPESVKSMCRVEIEPCLIATGGTFDKPDESFLWRGVLAKLSSMRVDACTTELKECLQDNERCGKDYSQCIGLDNEFIVAMCPEDKLVACYKQYGEDEVKVRDTLVQIAKGILLNIDNNLLKACEQAVADAMIKYCGNEYDCNGLLSNDLGTHSLTLRFCRQNGSDKYNDCRESIDSITDIELGRTTRDIADKQVLNERYKFIGVMGGEIAWEQIKVNQDANGIKDISQYLNELETNEHFDELAISTIKSELESMNEQIRHAIENIEQDPRVAYCMTGRKLTGLKDSDTFSQFINKTDNPRFPNLTRSYRNTITGSMINAVRDNYYRKYDELYDKLIIGEHKLRVREAKIDGLNEREYVQDFAHESCLALGKGRSPNYLVPGSDSRSTFESGKALDGLSAWNMEQKFLGDVVVYKRATTTKFDRLTGDCEECIETAGCLYIWGSWCGEWESPPKKCKTINFFDN